MAPEAPAVELNGVTKRIGRIVAVDGLDLRVEPGQVLGLAGPNGAGKSITLRMLLGLVRPSAGTAAIFGERVRPGAPVLRRVGALVDGPGFVPHLSGRANLRLGLRASGREKGPGDLERAVAVTGLGEAIDRRYSTYSHGMRYRLALGQALAGAPDLLLLDEPMTGLDPGHIREIRKVIAAEAARGATVVFSSHRLDDVAEVCSHAAVMDRGRLVGYGTIAELLAGPAGEVRLSDLEEKYLRLVEAARERETGGIAP